MTTRRVPAVAAAILAVVAVTTIAWSLGAAGDPAGGGLRLEVWDHEHGRAAYVRPMGDGEQFQLRHTHSVTRRPVIETFSVTGAGVAMQELWFDEFGPNLPAGPERIGEVTTTFHSEPGGFRVEHHGRLLPSVPLRVGGPAVDHVLTFPGGDRVRLLDLVRPAAYVEIRVTGG